MTSNHEDYQRQSADNFPNNESPFTQELIKVSKRLAAENVALRARCEEQEKQIAILELKNKGSLANNLCPDCRDKQVGKLCLACTIQAQQRVIEMARDALGGWKGVFENCTIESGVCGCGNGMLNHPMDDHQPVDYGTYIAGQLYDKTTEALAAMKEKP